MLSVTPPALLFDELPRLDISGCPPRTEVKLEARMTADDGRLWRSWASFLSGDDGRVDLETQTPSDGTYFGLGAGGLLWGMEPSAGPERVRPFFRESLADLEVELRLSAQGQVERQVFRRSVLGAGVVQETFEPGILFRPMEQPAPGVVLIASGLGGRHLEGAALLASRGYTVLQVTLPRLHRVPVERVDEAVAWLASREETLPGGVFLVGSGRGGELALLAATRLRNLLGVVSCSGSGLVFQGEEDAPWTVGGEPVGYAALDFSRLVPREPIRTREVFAEAVVDRANRDRGRIEVERITAPILLLSGADDQVWPSSAFSELVVQRLRKLGSPAECRHLTFPETGHLLGPELGPPHRPTSCLLLRDEKTCLIHDMGGLRARQAHAQRESWSALLEFLARLARIKTR